MISFTVTGEFPLETLPYPAFIHPLPPFYFQHRAPWPSDGVNITPPLSPPWTLAALGATATVLAVTPWPYIKESLVPLRFPPSYLPALYISAS